MMTALRKFSLASVLMVCMMNAFAYPGNNGDAQSESRLQWLEASQARREGEHGFRQEERRGRDERQYGGRGFYGNDQGNAGNQEDQRRGRMSPEERRALRQQINEAGRDIYRPQR